MKILARTSAGRLARILGWDYGGLVSGAHPRSEVIVLADGAVYSRIAWLSQGERQIVQQVLARAGTREADEG